MLVPPGDEVTRLRQELPSRPDQGGDFEIQRLVILLEAVLLCGLAHRFLIQPAVVSVHCPDLQLVRFSVEAEIGYEDIAFRGTSRSVVDLQDGTTSQQLLEQAIPGRNLRSAILLFLRLQIFHLLQPVALEETKEGFNLKADISQVERPA